MKEYRAPILTVDPLTLTGDRVPCTRDKPLIDASLSDDDE